MESYTLAETEKKMGKAYSKTTKILPTPTVGIRRIEGCLNADYYSYHFSDVMHTIRGKTAQDIAQESDLRDETTPDTK